MLPTFQRCMLPPSSRLKCVCSLCFEKDEGRREDGVGISA